MSILSIANALISSIFAFISVMLLMNDMPNKVNLKKTGVTYSHFRYITMVYWLACVVLMLPLASLLIGFSIFVEAFGFFFLLFAIALLIQDARQNLPKLNYSTYMTKVIRPLPVFGALVTFDLARFGFRMFPALATYIDDGLAALMRLLF